jgi:hypothetical protein
MRILLLKRDYVWNVRLLFHLLDRNFFSLPYLLSLIDVLGNNQYLQNFVPFQCGVAIAWNGIITNSTGASTVPPEKRASGQIFTPKTVLQNYIKSYLSMVGLLEELRFP